GWSAAAACRGSRPRWTPPPGTRAPPPARRGRRAAGGCAGSWSSSVSRLGTPAYAVQDLFGYVLIPRMHKLAGMDLLQLRYFQAVARHEHVSRAAEELRIAQPALSRSIARLEAELGVPLFDRRGRRVRLNRFGAMFLARAGRALDELDPGQLELRDAAGLAQGTVAVAAQT